MPMYPDKPYTGIVDYVVRSTKKEGVTSLWRGNRAIIIRHFPIQALNFSTKDLLSRTFLKGFSQHEERAKYSIGCLLSGGIAGAISHIFFYPIDLLRMKLLADIRKNRGGAEKEFSGLLDCCSKTFKKDGVLGIYRGFGASVLTVFTFRAFYFGYTDRLTQRLRCWKKVHLGLIRKTE